MSIYGECFDDELHDDLKHTGNFVIKINNVIILSISII